MRAWIACLPLFLTFPACSPSASDAESSAPVAVEPAAEKHAESGLPVIPVFVKSQGQVYKFKVELARTRLEQARGLMFRTSLGANAGMLFPFDPPREASFWMKNTVIPLDIVFIGADRRILNIAANAVPYDETPLLSRGQAAAVLELPGGRAAQLGIGPGDKVEW